MPSGGGPAAPPLPRPAAGGRGNLLADIQKGGRLKKVSESEKRDRSAATLPGGGGGGDSGAPPSPAPGGGEGGLAGALASALAARKSKVSASGKSFDNVTMVSLC